MTYKDLILLIYHSDLPEKTKQVIYDLRVSNDESFSGKLRSRLLSIIDTGVQYHLGDEETPGTLLELLNNESEALSLDDSYRGLPSVLGAAPFIKHAERLVSLRQRVLACLSDFKVLNQALLSRESFSFTGQDTYDTNDVLAFLYGEDFEIDRHLDFNVGRIFKYLSDAFGKERYSIDRDLKSYRETGVISDELRRTIVLEAVLSAMNENIFISEDHEFSDKLFEVCGNDHEKIGKLTRELKPLQMIISGDGSNHLFAYHDELIARLDKTLDSYLEMLSQVDVKPLDRADRDVMVHVTVEGIYRQMSDYHLVNNCMQGMSALVSHELSYPFNYVLQNTGLLKLKPEEHFKTKKYDDNKLLHTFDPRFAKIDGFSADVQEFYNSQPVEVRLHIGAVVSNVIANAVEGFAVVQDAIQNYHSDTLEEKRLKILNANREAIEEGVKQSLSIKSLQEAIRTAQNDKEKVSIINNIFIIETEYSKDPDLTHYKVFIDNLKLAMTAFSHHPNEQALLGSLQKISENARQGNIHQASIELAHFLYEKVVDEVFAIPLDHNGNLLFDDKNGQEKIEALIEAAGCSVLSSIEGNGADDLLPVIIERLAQQKNYPGILTGSFNERLNAIANNLTGQSPAVPYYLMQFLSAATFVQQKGNSQPNEKARITADEFGLANTNGMNRELSVFAENQSHISLDADFSAMHNDHRVFDRFVKDHPELIRSHVDNALRTAVADLTSYNPDRIIPFSLVIPSYDKSGPDFIVFEEDGNQYLRVIHDDMRVMQNINGHANEIGRIGGSIEAVYQLEKSKNESQMTGLKLAFFETDHPQLKALLENRWNEEVNLAKFLLANTDIKKVPVESLKYAESEQLLEEQIAIMKAEDAENPFARQAETVLNAVRAVKTDHDEAVKNKNLTRVLYDAAVLIKYPTQSAAKDFKNLASHVQRRPWGKVLAGAMMALAGFALVGLSIAAAVFTFGAAAPLSILGFTLGASTLGAGLSVAGAVVGAGVAVGGIGLFSAGVKRTDLRKAMDDLADDEGFRGPGR